MRLKARESFPPCLMPGCRSRVGHIAGKSSRSASGCWQKSQSARSSFPLHCEGWSWPAGSAAFRKGIEAFRKETARQWGCVGPRASEPQTPGKEGEILPPVWENSSLRSLFSRLQPLPGMLMAMSSSPAQGCVPSEGGRTFREFFGHVFNVGEGIFFAG